MNYISKVEGEAEDTMTPINICNHTYWNISGDFTHPTVKDHKLNLPNSSKVIELRSSDLIPTGKFPLVKDTPFDFHKGMERIGDCERLTGAIDGGGQPGVDHPFVVDG